MSNEDMKSEQNVGRPGHRRLADGILDAMDQAEGQGRTDVADQLRRVHQCLIDQESAKYDHRRVVD
ncbi:MAG: hypothetical protein VCD33_11485 [Alphaproteobacteria bacterium]|jgi:hypothetical protein